MTTTMPAPTDLGRALVGAVEHLPADAAVRVLDLIHDDDLTDPRVRVVAAVARQLAEEGIAPDPAAILAHARATGTVTKADAVQNFALLVAELYAECATPASATFYAVATLQAAIRCRVADAGVRLTQAAEAESHPSLLALVDSERAAVRELADRLAAAAGTARPRLAAVPGVGA